MSTTLNSSLIPLSLDSFFTSRGWQPFPFQREAWQAYRDGQSGLIHAPTGVGKTLAAWLGPVAEWIDEHPDADTWPNMDAPPLTVLWITPLRALARDTTAALESTVAALGLPWTVELRTGDTSSSKKQRQRKKPPTALVTTPESLSLLLSYPDTQQKFRHLRCVVVDEWHELISTKRGTQTELGLARLRRWNPTLRTWGLSATLGNLDEAMDVLLGDFWTRKNAEERGSESAEEIRVLPHSSASLISADLNKPITIETLIPPNIERFPWAGHIGTKLVPQVVARVQAAASTLIFCNTRAQAELWFQAITDYTFDHATELIGSVGLHHGSIERALRNEVEARLDDGRLRCVVATSSLDLGVDFAPVEQVVQIGSPKGAGRLLQRAGRSGHNPGRTSRVICVPTHAFELVEFAAARDAIERGEIESRAALHKPLDVLAQHLVTLALGGGFSAEAGPLWSSHAGVRTGGQDDADSRSGHSQTGHPPGAGESKLPGHPTSSPTPLSSEERELHPIRKQPVRAGGEESVPAAALFHEIRSTSAYRDLTPAEWRWALDFITTGGDTLQAYDDYHKVKLVDGQYKVQDRRVGRFHRMSIGTITSDGMLNVAYQSGGNIGRIEESFAGRLKQGDVFIFAGRLLEFRRVKEMTVQVRRASKRKGIVPRWAGSRMSLSSQLADAVRLRLAAAEVGIFDTPEMEGAEPILRIQQKWSRLPVGSELLIERIKTREGFHAFLYPLAGRLAHEGLATLLAYRLSSLRPLTISVFANDYGIELLSETPLEGEPDGALDDLPVQMMSEDEWRALLSTENLLDDVLGSLNQSELARRQFRDIARIAGLIFAGYPGSQKTTRQLQTSSAVLYDVFTEYDPNNALLQQARREVLEQQLEIGRLRVTLEEIAGAEIVQVAPKRLTPMAFPIWASRLRTQTVSSEKWTDRVQKMVVQLERAADR